MFTRQWQGWGRLRALLDNPLLLSAAGIMVALSFISSPAHASSHGWESHGRTGSLVGIGGPGALIHEPSALMADAYGLRENRSLRTLRVRVAQADTGTANDGNCGNGNNGSNNGNCGGGGNNGNNGGNGGSCSNGNNSRGCRGATIDCGNTNKGNGRGGNNRGCDHEVRDLQPGERFEGAGVIGDTTNAGVIAPGGETIDTLTVDGRYVGKGGTLELDTVLGNDQSSTDQLIVTGDTEGDTNVKVTNRGGLGAPTSEGIKVIDVQGASNGTFTLLGDYNFQKDPAVIAGAYGYSLKEADGDWYLRSTYLDGEGDVRPIYQPGVPLYEAYPQVLQALNGLPTMQQRIGNRYWGDETAKGFLSGGHSHSALWARVEGSRTSLLSEHSTAGAHSDVDRITARAGLDGLFSETGEGRMIGGLTMHYGTVTADIGSIYGRGDIKAKGYGLGGTLTWLGWDGLYVDSQAQLTWFDGKLDSDTLGSIMAKNNNGFGYGLGVELGKRVDLGGAWGLVPQAQLMYSAVDFDGFTDPFGAKVRLDDGDALTGRLGLATEYRESWKNASGTVSRANFYGIANLYYAFDGKTGVDVSNAKLVSSTDKLWGGIGAGGTYGWTDQVALFAEATANTSLANFGDSYSYSGTAGLRLTW